MSIAENHPGEEKLELLGKRYFGKALVSEAELQDLLGAMTVEEWAEFAARMIVVIDITNSLIEKQSERMGEAELGRMKEMSREGKGRSSRQVMEAIIRAIEEGREGVESARKTASVALDMVFIWMPEYFSARKRYEEKLRQLGRSA